MKYTAKTALMLGFVLSGCSTHTVNSYLMPESSGLTHETKPSQMSHLSVKAYTYMLADELLQPLANQSLNGKVIVTQFVDEQTRQPTIASSAPLASLGGQLAEGFVYELNKRGYKVTDFKLRKSVEVNESGDFAWSRDLADLKNQVDAKYILAGTLTPHQNGAVVNVRLMEMNNGLVISTAQGFVPENLFWSKERVTTRDGVLMHKGETSKVLGENNETYF